MLEAHNKAKKRMKKGLVAQLNVTQRNRSDFQPSVRNDGTILREREIVSNLGGRQVMNIYKDQFGNLQFDAKVYCVLQQEEYNHFSYLGHR